MEQEYAFEKDPKQDARCLAKHANGMLLLTLLVYIGVSTIVSSLIPVIPFLEDSAVQILIIQFCMVLPAIFFLYKKRLSLVEFMRFRAMKPLTILLVVVYTFVSYPIITLFNYISLLFSDNLIGNTVESMLSSRSLIGCVFTIALIPCIVEEFIFRGVLYQSYEKLGKGKAMWITACLFGLFHMNVNQMSYAIAIGVLLVCLNEATGSLFSSMLMHFLINTVSVVSSALLYKNQQSIPDVSMKFEPILLAAYVIMACISLVILYGILCLITRIEKRPPVPGCLIQPKERKGKVVSVTLVIAFVVCLLMMILTEISIHMS